jgi:hypothetical protein
MGQLPEINSAASAYNLNTWLSRAEYFLALNYPELAAGDAYKALLLIERDYNDPEAGETSDKKRKAQDVLSQALYDCHCHRELMELRESMSLSNEAHDKFAGIEDMVTRKEEAANTLGGTSQEVKDRVRDGGVITVDYTWIPRKHSIRNQKLVDFVNAELIDGTEPRNCYWGRSTLASDGDMMGMFAARDFKPGEHLLLDRTATAACSDPERGACDNCFGRLLGPSTEAPCCAVLYCSPDCRDLAITTYHKALCTRGDFSWLQTRASGLTHNASPLRPLLMLRVLATCVQAGHSMHPLDHPLLARLQPLSNRAHLDVFTLAESIVTPLEILEQLGIDIFGDLRFDTMVLHTIWSRLANNKAGSPDPRLGFVDEISPHLPLFNHACEPNVEWRRRDGSTTILFTVKREVKAGQELFSSYLDVGGMGLEERTQALWPWFEGPCLCETCRWEREGLEE